MTVVSGERGDRGRPTGEKTKAKRPPPGARWPEAGLGPPGVPAPPTRPLVPGLWAELAPASPGDRTDTPGPGGPGGRERDGAGPRHARPKWATSGAAPRAGSPARSRRRKRKRKNQRQAEATPNRHRPLARPRRGRRARPSVGRGARGHPWRSRPWALTRSPDHTAWAAASSLPRAEPGRPQRRLGDRSAGREPERRGSAGPGCGAAGPAVPGGRGARVHARGGGAGASPVGPARMLPPHLPRSGFRSPGSAVDAGRQLGLSGGREVAAAFSSSASFPFLLPGKESPKSWLLPA